jgi:hypothetical protein
MKTETLRRMMIREMRLVLAVQEKSTSVDTVALKNLASVSQD